MSSTPELAQKPTFGSITQSKLNCLAACLLWVRLGRKLDVRAAESALLTVTDIVVYPSQPLTIRYGRDSTSQAGGLKSCGYALIDNEWREGVSVSRYRTTEDGGALATSGQLLST
jgi:hypothetical protein